MASSIDQPAVADNRSWPVKQPPHSLQLALAELFKAYCYAEATPYGCWDLAVEIRLLESLGASATDLRWLVCMGYVEQAEETTQTSDPRRTFGTAGNLSFTLNTSFVLTPAGVAYACQVIGSVLEADQQALEASCSPSCWTEHAHQNGQTANGKSLQPVWDHQRHELWLGKRMVKRFRWPAANQETILSAFEEESWPARIDDPLPPREEIDPKRRLHDTIKCLNRNQANRLVWFRGDGTGEGVLWQVASD